MLETSVTPSRATESFTTPILTVRMRRSANTIIFIVHIYKRSYQIFLFRISPWLIICSNGVIYLFTCLLVKLCVHIFQDQTKNSCHVKKKRKYVRAHFLNIYVRLYVNKLLSAIDFKARTWRPQILIKSLQIFK